MGIHPQFIPVLNVTVPVIGMMLGDDGGGEFGGSKGG